jgi:hypothetical protein
MKRTLLTVVVTAVLTLMLFGGDTFRAPVQPVPVQAQATTTRTDLISNYLANAVKFLA